MSAIRRTTIGVPLCRYPCSFLDGASELSNSTLQKGGQRLVEYNEKKQHKPLAKEAKEMRGT